MEKSDQSEAKTVYGRGRMGREVLGECSPQGSNLLGAEPVAGEPGKGQPARVREGAQWSWSPCGQGGVSVCCRPRSANSVSRGKKTLRETLCIVMLQSVRCRVVKGHTKCLGCALCLTRSWFTSAPVCP